MITLKAGYNNQVLQSCIQKVIPILSRKPPQYEVKCHAIHDEENQIVRLKCYLLKNKKQIIHGAQCVVRVYTVNRQDFTESSTYTAPTVIAPNALGEFVSTLSEANLSAEFVGDNDFAIEVEILRFKKKYKHKFYFNELGIYDFALRIKRRTEFLAITKRSIGQEHGYF